MFYWKIITYDFVMFDQFVEEDLVKIRILNMKIVFIHKPEFINRALCSDLCQEKPRYAYSLGNVEKGMAFACSEFELHILSRIILKLLLSAEIWQPQRKHYGVSFNQVFVNSSIQTYCHVMDGIIESMMNKHSNGKTFNVKEFTENASCEMLFATSFDIDIKQFEEGDKIKRIVSESIKM